MRRFYARPAAVSWWRDSPARLAELADRRMKAPREQLVEALRGRVTEHHRFMLRVYLDQYDRLVEAIATIDAATEAAIARMDQR